MLTPTEDNTEADRRYQRFVRSDPLPEIPPALLNSSDIYNYVALTGMICPFVVKELKSASCSIHIGNKIVYWGEEQELVDRDLRLGESFTVAENSIVYVKTKEKFRLPDYIAMRFNLKINNVHRGILLGTGPIVDPGFVGHLLIPLHNLTTNSYVFHEGEEFVWAEFTKISPHPRWNTSFRPSRFPETYNPDHLEFFPERKKNLKVWDYLNQASKTTIRSSISRIGEDVRRFGATLKWSAIAGAVTILVGVFGWLIPLLVGLKGDVAATQGTFGPFQVEMRTRQGSNEQALNQLNRDFVRVQTEIAAMEERQSRSRLDEMEARIERVEGLLRDLQSKMAK